MSRQLSSPVALALVLLLGGCTPGAFVTSVSVPGAVDQQQAPAQTDAKKLVAPDAGGITPGAPRMAAPLIPGGANGTAAGSPINTAAVCAPPPAPPIQPAQYEVVGNLTSAPVVPVPPTSQGGLTATSTAIAIPVPAPGTTTATVATGSHPTMHPTMAQPPSSVSGQASAVEQVPGSATMVTNVCGGPVAADPDPGIHATAQAPQ